MHTLRLLALSLSLYAQTPDTILVNAKILTVDPQFSVQEALAIRGDRIVAVGTSANVRKQAGPATRVIDLQGRTVIPGMIDSHMHAIRAALSFSTEVNWIGARSIPEALARITQAAKEKKPGSWLIVAGGWDVAQFKENRPPTQDELTAAAPNNPVYVQLGYSWAIMNPLGYRTMGIAGPADLPVIVNGPAAISMEPANLPLGVETEKDANGKPTGALKGSQSGIVALFDRLPRPTFADQLDGTPKFFRELNRLGLTGVMDPGGNNMVPDSYQAVEDIWRAGKLTVRINYAMCGFTPGQEFEEYKTYTHFLPAGFGDDMFRFVGIGERITAAMNNNDHPSDTDKERYYQIVKWAADRGMSVTMHWNNDSSVNQLLDIWERVNKETPIAPLRWSIAHLNDASDGTLQRMKALGVGWTVQDAMYFEGDGFVKQRGKAVALRVPPVVSARRIGVAAGAGTDAHRVASYNPFTALQWFLDGKTVGGTAIRGPEETPSRMEALRLYTLGSTWFSKDENKRGSLEVGKLADLAVLSKDYLTVPVDQVGSIESVLTMVGGKVVYGAGPFAALEIK